MLDEKTIRALAARIEQARNTHELIRPVTAQFPEATIEDAYAIQRAWVAIRLAAGYRVLGHKIGLTSKNPGPARSSTFRRSRGFAPHRALRLTRRSRPRYCNTP